MRICTMEELIHLGTQVFLTIHIQITLANTIHIYPQRVFVSSRRISEECRRNQIECVNRDITVRRNSCVIFTGINNLWQIICCT